VLIDVSEPAEYAASHARARADRSALWSSSDLPRTAAAGGVFGRLADIDRTAFSRLISCTACATVTLPALPPRISKGQSSNPPETAA